MARYLVTGGRGFIGSHLSEALIKQHHQVRVLDNLSTGCRENLPAGGELVIGDITDPIAVRHALADVDGVFHLAAIASVERSNQDWATFPYLTN
jgi:UDP-glucose 4-epimerase